MNKENIDKKFKLPRKNLFLNRTGFLLCSSLSHPIFIISIITTIFLLLSFKTYVTNSEGFYNYLSFIWKKTTIPPYNKISTDSSPGILLIHYISYNLFGFSIRFTRLISLIANISATIIIYLTARKIYDKTAALFAMTLAGLSLTWISVSNQFEAQPDSFMIFFTSCAFLALTSSKDIRSDRLKYLYLLITGCFIGCAVMFKQTAIFSLIGLLLYCLFDTKTTFRKKTVLFVLTGFLLITATFLALIFLFWTTPNLYFSNVWLSFLKHEQVSIYKKMALFLDTWRYSEFTFFYPLIFVFIIFRKKFTASSLPYWAIFAWLVCDFIGVNASTFLWGTNYKQIIPSLSIVCGISIGFIINSFTTDNRYEKTFLLKIMVTVLILFIPFRELFFYSSVKNAQHIREKDFLFAKWINQNISKKNRIYILSEKAALIRMIAQTIAPQDRLPDVTAELSPPQKTTQLQKNFPKFIAISPENQNNDWLTTILDQQYESIPQEEIFENKYGFLIYIKKQTEKHRFHE